MKFMKIMLITMLTLGINQSCFGMWQTMRTNAAQVARKTAAYIRMQAPKIARAAKQTLKNHAPHYCTTALTMPVIGKKDGTEKKELKIGKIDLKYINNFNPLLKEKCIEIVKAYLLKTDCISVQFVCSLIQESPQIAKVLTPYAASKLDCIHPDILQTILQYNPHAADAFIRYFAVLNCDEQTQEKQKAVLLGLLDNHLIKRTLKDQRNPMHLLLPQQTLNWEFNVDNKTTTFAEYLFDTFVKNPHIISYSFHGLIVDHCAKIHRETATKFFNIIRASYAHKPQDGIIVPFNPSIHLQRTKVTSSGNLGDYYISHNAYHHIYIIFSETAVAGYVILNRDRNYVAYLFVESTKRKKHYGQKLMEQAIMHFRQNETSDEFKEITLYSLADEAPRSLYEKLGFKAPDRTHYKLV